MLGLAALREGLDDEHAPAAARAGLRVYARLGWLHQLRLIGLAHGRRHGEQRAGACDVGRAIAGAAG